MLALADTCVKCGLCLPHCPTYSVTRQEPDSPRGRIAIIQGLLTQNLTDSPRLHERLSRCLECHACEAMCPSKVPVTLIIDATRAIQTKQQPIHKSKLRYWLLSLAVYPAHLMPWVRYYQHSWLRVWLQRSGLLKYLQLEQADNLLPKFPLASVKIDYFSAKSAQRGTVAIFPGCVGRYLDAPVLNAAIKILTRIGYNVSIPQQHCCCGALYRHDGFALQADLELAQSVQLLQGYSHILTLASACLAELQYAPSLAGKIKDASRFIADLTWPADLIKANPPQKTVWVHTPCTQRHPVNDKQVVIDLLARIPKINLLALPKNDLCCGAAGTYMLRQP
ncbi:hypothetical protein TI03_01970, partial [Achromatium sp. WMS1]